MAVIKIKRQTEFDPKKPDIFVIVRLSEDTRWIYNIGRCRSIKEARMRATAYGENVEYKITVDGVLKEHHKIQKGYLPGRISSAELPTLGKRRP